MDLVSPSLKPVFKIWKSSKLQLGIWKYMNHRDSALPKESKIPQCGIPETSSPSPKVQPRCHSSPDSLSGKMWGQGEQRCCPQCWRRDMAGAIARLWGQGVKAGTSERTGSLRWNLKVRRWCFESRWWEEEGGRERQAERSLGCELFLNVQATGRYHLSHISGGSSNTMCPSIKRLSMVWQETTLPLLSDAEQIGS